MVESGDDKTKAAAITVVQRLAIQAVSLVTTPPKYVGAEAYNSDLTGKPAQVVFGCFIIFGAATIASGIFGMISGSAPDAELGAAPDPAGM